MTVYVTGDVHGRAEYGSSRFTSKSWPLGRTLTRDDVVIVAGDFGFVWDGSNAEKYWLDWFESKPWTTCFVDGNHENHHALANLPVREWNGGLVHEVRPHVLHLMRGEVFDIDGLTVLAMGGAASNDRQYRREGRSWWPEEMPSEEGYPAYLASRIAQFYERAGCVECLGADERHGSVTAIGAVSPPGGDISEPVSQATMRIVKVFWALDSSLAYARHFPAINWLTSYSLYVDTLAPWYKNEFGEEYMANRDKAMHILQEESELQEIVRLVGQDALSPADRLTMETAKMLREDFLQQNAFVDEDAYSSYGKQFELMNLILSFDRLGREALSKGAPMKKLFAISAREKIGRAKMVAPDKYEQEYEAILDQMRAEIDEVIAGGEDA